MTLTLQHEEVQQYFDMRDDIIEYKERIAELIEALELCNSVPFYDEQSPHDYPSDTTREEHTSARWSDYDRARITSRIFLTGTYYGSDREFSTIRTLFPERTEAAVKSMIYTLGGTIKKGIVHPRIQPKHKGE